MKKIWLQKIDKPTSQTISWRVLQILAIALMILSFSFFSLYHSITNWLFSPNKIDIFNDLDQISFYFWMIDPELSKQVQTFDSVIKAYLDGENVLKTKENEITQLRAYAKEKKNYLTKVWFSNYEKAFEMLDQARDLRAEIFKLLGKDQTFNYLIPLQNSNEARPNGGFFGSFAFVSLSGGHIVDLQVVDSYLPDYIAPNTRVELPNRIAELNWGKTIGFIAGNKLGFTDKDWKNLKTLYEKIFHTDFNPERRDRMFKPEKRNQLFHKDIKGVIFLDSELIAHLLPSFRHKAREWQFVNANIDIIRWEARSNKKELYIADLEKYLKENALRLASSALNNLQNFLEKWYINIYLSNTSGAMRDFLDKWNLTTVYDSDFLYFWHTNIAYNKSDAFIKKQLEIQTLDGKVILSTENKKVDISHLSSGNYRLMITYTFDVPKTYIDEIHMLEQKYDITMTERESYILALQPRSPDQTAPLQRRAGKEFIHLPKNRTITAITGDLTEQKVFNSDFSQWITYKTRITTSPQTNTAYINFTIP